jgi:hypothetical protein
LQHTTSALTTAIFGAALTASTVLAQQLPSQDDAPAAESSSAKSLAVPNSATAAVNSQLYGMTATRGARYLLRNGLDYLSYQQYDRALKFLRDAEARVDQQKVRKVQKELNDAEVLALKQGIDAAQRGLRRASDAESPYALSDQSRPSHGFTPAKPMTRLAANSNQARSPDRMVKATSPAPPNLLGSDGDEKGEPIRLASGETSVNDKSTQTSPAPNSINNKNAPTVGHAEFDEPANIPETPQIPTVSRLPDLTEANGSDRLVTVDEQVAVKPEPLPSRAPAVSERTSTRSTGPNIREQAPAFTSSSSNPVETTPADLQPASDHQSMPAKLVTTPVVEDNRASQPEPVSPLPGLAPAPDPVPSATDPTPNSAGQAGEPAAVDDVPLPVAQNPTAAASNAAALVESSPPLSQTPDLTLTAAPTKINLETISSSTPAGDAGPAVDLSAPSHTETEDVVPVSMASPAQPETAAKPTITTASIAASPVNDDLPPLPADLSRVTPDAPLTATPAALPTAAAPVSPTPADDGLPPLPADLGRSAPARPAGIPTPVQTLAAPTLASTNVSEQPTRSAETVPAHTADESLPALSADTETRPAPTVPEREGSAPTLAPTSPETPTLAGSAPVAIPSPINTELPPGPRSNTSSSPATPVNSPYPTTNPNLEPRPAVTTAAVAETTPDVSSLPPAIPGRMVTTSSDAFIPDRPNPPSTLQPELRREVERIARNQEEEMRRQARNPPQEANPPRDTMASDLRTQTQMDISRAPSPAEARPIKAIPVPEDWVPLAPRSWAPQRKYWAAAATCHLPLYFQDPVLERYGHSVEQFVGPLGRFLTYPVDDPTQSTQRNQILQPFFSAGLMALQIAAWPYNLIMDPPWEAQYDLGYYRPGDNIPTDTYWLPLHGYGPPLRGSNY